MAFGPLTRKSPARCRVRRLWRRGQSNFTGDIKLTTVPLEKKLQRTIRKGSKVMCREIEMGVAVAQLALHDACVGTVRGATGPRSLRGGDLRLRLHHVAA